MPFREIIDNLLEEQEKANNTTYFLSVYQPVNEDVRTNLKKHLRALILSEMKNHKELKNLKKFRHVLAERAIKEIEGLKSLGRGLGIFVKFDVSKIKNKKEKKLESSISSEDIVITRLFREPEKEAYIGKTYDLDQLVWTNNNPIESLVISLSRKRAQLFAALGDRIEMITEIKNKHLKTKEKEFHAEFYPTRESQVHHGSGDDKLSRRELKENRKLLQDVTTFIKQSRMLKKRYDFLLVFYSSSFTELIEDFARENSLRSNFQPITKAKNIEEKEKLKKETLKEIKKFEKKTKKEILEEAKNDSLYTEDWEKICEAARMERIKELFVEVDAKQEGYVDKEGLTYLEEKEDAKKVKNIVPWILRRVIDSNGRVSVLREISVGNDQKIAASLRY